MRGRHGAHWLASALMMGRGAQRSVILVRIASASCFGHTSLSDLTTSAARSVSVWTIKSTFLIFIVQPVTPMRTCDRDNVCCAATTRHIACCSAHFTF